MPRPVYILFCDSGSVDNHTNRVSLFNVIEIFKVLLNPTEGAEDQVKSTIEAGTRISSKLGGGQRVTAVWMREDGDTPDAVFETQLTCLAPDGTSLFSSPMLTFSFKTWFQRFDVYSLHIPGFPSLGVYAIESRVRRVGEQEWQWRQSFPFVVEEFKPAPTKSLPDAAPDENTVK